MTAPSGGDGFRADVPSIRRHAGEVQGYGDRIGTAHGAASTAMSSNAFGVFGQFLASATITQAEVVKDVIEAGEKSMHQLGTALDDAATTYEKTDDENDQLLERLRNP
ncbi:hypothetical protein FHX42_000619 [Saccharopolyspora lacisalsi]|uniref:ESX-1 secretion-associated protein n=1 Tax=Halosaccharopolyspora lacisalsi TaxID=1000566 RepID=A0A839DQQ3_9PSEU|nr:type VII secretion target [Halosaccharopolyspora lacisalsi]MBA8823290.1 hypothetical protein [Halosaccharopolyspora lacisalsi]